MQITPASVSAFQQGQAADKVSVAVAKEVLDQQRSQGDAAVDLIEAAGETSGNPGGRVADNGLGGTFDVSG